ncbi:MAG: hypothetical protein KF915_20425 [Polyangiaceae bacterium]|nr:hypothetical protein [Polyangiaceae bacterium]
MSRKPDESPWHHQQAGAARAMPLQHEAGSTRGALLILALLGSLGCGGCDSNGPSARPVDGGADATGNGGAGGHLTDASPKPDAHPDAARDADVSYGGAKPLLDASVDLDAGSLPDCGPGCRLALKVRVFHAAWGHGHSTRWVADTNPDLLAFAEVGSDQTWIVHQPSTFARVNGDHIAHFGFDSWPKGEIAVINAAERTRRVYHTFEDSREHGFSELTLTDKHVIWSERRGLFKANLETGAISQLNNRPLDCREGCTAQGAIYCVNTNTGRVDRIDEETGELTHLDDGGALQVAGGCSPDRKKIVWVDHRPPGEPSGYMGYRGAAEIYLHDIPTGKTERLTFDSPANGVAKINAVVGTDWVMWREPCPTCAKTYPTASGLDYAATRHVRLDLATRKKCTREGFQIGYPSLHGHHLYGYWSDGTHMYLVDLDLDHPNIGWVCDD